MSRPDNWPSTLGRRWRPLAGGNAAWLKTAREQALNRFLTEGWPTSRLENWRHTSLANLEGMQFDVPCEVGSPSASPIQALKAGQGGHWLVFVDGLFSSALSELSQLPEGVALRSLGEVLEENPDQIQDWYGTPDDGSAVQALNLAMTGDGAVLTIDAGVQLTEPVHWVFMSASSGCASFTRNFVVLGEGASADLVEHHIGVAHDVSLSNTVVRGVLRRDARLVHAKVQQEGLESYHLSSVDIHQEAGSSYTSHTLSFGARLARNDIVTHLNEPGSETLLNGLYFVDGRRHIDHHTWIDHASPSCTSHEYYRGILKDTGRGVFTGRIRVAPGADGTDAVQRSDSLLLSRMARADARPELEIYADDVKCAHGATVGQIDEGSLFYLRARGLDEDHARSLLTYAFAAQALQRIEQGALRTQVSKLIRGLLPGGQWLGELS